MFRTTLAVSIWFAAACLGRVLASEPISFEESIRPILKQHCWHCHGEEPKLEGGFDARLSRFLLRGGESGAAIEPGAHEKSLLFQRIAAGEMPPGDTKVSADQMVKIAAWIDQGATTTDPEPESLDVGDVILDSDRHHWSFRPIQRPSLPTVESRDRVRTPIDAFLLSRLESSGLGFSGDADRITLVRRLYFDLLGLPPDRAAVDGALEDASDEWYEKTVDRLLASPAYGERWGRHWLDVVGYADSDGYTEKDAERKWAWRYRDYVIRSFNADKPWNQMIVEQVAGDELVQPNADGFSEGDVEKLTATGFLRMVPDGTADSGVDVKVASNDVMAETIKVVSSSLLGLTVGCAQCHSHRYDPISQTDYYRFRAVFEPAYNWQSWKTPKDRLISLWTEATHHQAKSVEDNLKAVANQRSIELEALVQETFEKELAKLPEEIQPQAREARATSEKERTPAQKALIQKYPFLNVNPKSVSLYLPDRLKGFNKKWDAASDAVRAQLPPDDYVHGLTEPTLAEGKPPETYVFARGDLNSPQAAIGPSELSVLLRGSNPVISQNDASSTTHRRLSYAKHLTDGKHPLVARVLVNRFWMQHFGRGLVATATDFGLLGRQPSHPELLDWLADEFMRQGWSLKGLHRLILTSTAYRQSSSRTEALDAVDPDNLLLGRMSLRRLEAEVVRDAVLETSGRISFKRSGPPVGVMPDEVGQIVLGVDTRDSAGRPTGKLIDIGEDAVRRSVYVQVRRSMPLGVLEPFDNPIMSPNCGQRACSTVAPQSLLLMNSQFVAECAEAFAVRIETEGAGLDNRARVQYAWLCAFGRRATDDETDGGEAFLVGDRSDVSVDNQAEADHSRLVQFCQALLCSNPFLYVE